MCIYKIIDIIDKIILNKSIKKFNFSEKYLNTKINKWLIKFMHNNKCIITNLYQVNIKQNDNYCKPYII